MSDVRARIADALREAIPEWFAKTAYGPSGESVADVLLSLPGIALVELPEPDGQPGRFFRHPAHKLIAERLDYYNGDHSLSSEEAVAVLSCLYRSGWVVVRRAAADAAEPPPVCWDNPYEVRP